MTATLSDSFGDGWNGNVLALKQDNLFYTFGQQFVAGNFFGTVLFSLSGDSEVSILVYILGSKTYEVGFTLRY